MTPQPGDLVLVKTNHFVSKLIRFGQRSYGKEASQWNHVAVVCGKTPKGEIIIVEALTKGVEKNPLSKYKPEEYKIVPVVPYCITLDAEISMRHNAVVFAKSCVGQKYGFVTIFAIALKTFTKGKFNFGVQGTEICSALWARQAERMGFNFNPWEPSEITPAYLDSLSREALGNRLQLRRR